VSAKAKVIVIKKFLAGEWDLLAYAYGTVGRCKVFVKRGIPSGGILLRFF